MKRMVFILLAVSFLGACSDDTAEPNDLIDDTDNRQVFEQWTHCTYTCSGVLLIAEYEVTVIRNGRQEKELRLDTLALNETFEFARDSLANMEFIAVVDTGGQHVATFWHEKRSLLARIGANLSLTGLEYRYHYSWQSYSPQGSGEHGHTLAGDGLAVSARHEGHYSITDTTVLRAQFSYERQAFGVLYDHSGTTQQSGVQNLHVGFTPEARVEIVFR